MKCLHPIIRGEFSFPCRQCIMCKKARLNEWSIRLEDEMHLHKHTIFVTLTYDPEHLPSPPLVSKRTATLFFKRLRKWISKYYNNTPIKYFICGEYGDESDRPHYHAIIFGYLPPDGYILKQKGTNILYHSFSLTSIWGLGFASYALCTPETIRYTLKYINKMTPNDITHRPFNLSSQGLGLQYLYNNFEKITNEQFIKTKYGNSSIPRYYVKKIREQNPDFMNSDNHYITAAEKKSKSDKNKKDKYLRTHKKTDYQEFIDRSREAYLQIEDFLENNIYMH